MSTVIPLNEMSTTEKLVALDQIWDDLMQNVDEIPFPEWHKEVLIARAKRIKNGEAKFLDWVEAKEQLRKEFK